MNIGSIVGNVVASLPAIAGQAAARGAATAGAPAMRALGLNATEKPAGSALDGLARGIGLSAGQRQAEQLGTLLSRFMKSAVTGGLTSSTSATSRAAAGTAAKSTSSSTASKTTSSTKTTSTPAALAFLKDARLSVEEKLARLMVYLSDKYEKQLEQKMQQYASLETGTAGSSSSTAKSSTSTSKSSSSPLSALGSGLSSLVSKAGLGSLLTGTLLPQLATQLAAPVAAGAATALGMPALAPMLLQAAPLLGSLASEALSGLTGSPGKATSGSTSGTTKSSTSSGSSSSASSASAPSEKQLMTEIQILQEKQKEMFTLVSNVLRSLHDTKMAVIGNLR
jgi:hypothetical protein